MSPHSRDLSGGTLDDYRAKRSPQRTPEPFGGEEGLRPGAFVVQKHAARRTHYDLRLEVGGVLKSWAVPKGPSLDPQEKRLAVETEDHPIEYVDFEGVIPAGNYGAGAMIVWDRGRWVPLEDVEEGYRRGKLLFELHGYKLRGVWTLFRTKPPAIRRGRDKNEDRQWLLVKKPDGAAVSASAAGSPAEAPREESILSGLTVEELRDGARRIDALRADLEAAGARAAALDVRRVKPMLAQVGERPFSRPGWIFELKYDGYRLLGAREPAGVCLLYRNGHDASEIFPELARALAALPVASVILDGEVVVLDSAARPSFQRLQKRALLSRPRDALQAAVEHPATYHVFDLLAFEGYDLRRLPLTRRKAFLARLLPPAGPLRYSDHVEERGEELFSQIERIGLEGMVAKEASSSYVGRRSPKWVKFRVERSGDFVIVGWSDPKGGRSGFASLHLAVCEPQPGGGPEPSALLYAGRVGSGFSDAELEQISGHLAARERADAFCRGELPRGKANHWVEPDLVCEVRYKEWTEQGMLRHPVYLRLRDDKRPQECFREPLGEVVRSSPSPPSETSKPAASPATKRPPAAERTLHLTNLDKVFWPEEGYTKGDLIQFYRTVAPAMLPYLEDRPVVLTRYPDGITGKSFFQKNAPDFAPAWIRTVTIWSEGSEREIDYFVCEDPESLVFLANLGTIPIHMWSSRLAQLGEPDWCILDLDPKQAPLRDVVVVAREIHALCTEIGLESYVKTSGSSGLHVLLPLGSSCTYEQSRLLGQLIAQVISSRRSDVATTVRNPARRDGRVYIDWGQNGHGRLLVAPYTVRPLPAAPVSTPLRWSEVTARLDLKRYNIRSVPRRLARLENDPMLEVLSVRPDLGAILERLGELLQA